MPTNEKIAIFRCYKCKQEKPISEFHKDPTRLNGLDSRCKKCKSQYEKKRWETHKEKRKNSFKEWYELNKERERAQKRQYAREHPEERRIYRVKLRLKLLQKVSGNNIPQCVNCGCDDIRFLEINHVNGGGSKEKFDVGGQGYFHRSILNGTRKTDDLNVLCKVCNSLDHLKRKYEIVPIEIVWNGKEVVSCQG